MLAPGYVTLTDHALAVCQRISVALSCTGLWTLLVFPGISVVPKALLLVILALLACIEKLGSIMTTLAVERDWVRF